MNTYLRFNSAVCCVCVCVQGSSQPLLSHVALAVASKLTSALFSAARYVCVKPSFHDCISKITAID